MLVVLVEAIYMQITFICVFAFLPTWVWLYSHVTQLRDGECTIALRLAGSIEPAAYKHTRVGIKIASKALAYYNFYRLWNTSKMYQFKGIDQELIGNRISYNYRYVNIDMKWVCREGILYVIIKEGSNMFQTTRRRTLSMLWEALPSRGCHTRHLTVFNFTNKPSRWLLKCGQRYYNL